MQPPGNGILQDCLGCCLQETESSSIEELNRFHDRYASRAITIGKSRKLTPGGPTTKVVLFNVKASSDTAGAATGKTSTGTAVFGTAHVGKDFAGRSTAGVSGSHCTLSKPASSHITVVSPSADKQSVTPVKE